MELQEEPSFENNEDDIMEKIEKLQKEAGDYRAQFEASWNEEERFYWGKQWKYTNNRPVKNLIFSIIEGELPILVDARPASDVIPREASMIDDAKVLSSAIEYTYEQQNLMVKVVESIRDALKSGPCGWHYVDYDPDLEDGQGAITITTKPWKHVFVDPTATTIEEAAYVIILHPMRKDDIKRKYPHFADQVDNIFTDGSEFESNTGSNQYYDPSKWDGIGGDESKSVYADIKRYKSEDIIYVRETYLKDYSLEKISDEETTEEIAKEAEEFNTGVNPDIFKWEDHKAHIEAHTQLEIQFVAQALGIDITQIDLNTYEQLRVQVSEQMPDVGVVLQLIADHIDGHKFYLEINPNGMRPKYAKNVRQIIDIGGEYVIFDGSPDVEDGMAPLVPYYAYKTSQSVYGFSETRNILDPQKSYNEMDYAEYKGLKLTSNSGWVKDENSGVDDETLTNEEGIVITKTQGTEVRRLEPGQVSVQLSNRKIMDQQSMEALSGISEVSQGRRPTGVTAASAIEALQQQAKGRIRLKTQFLEEYSLLRLGRLVASRIVKYWNTERLLRLYDNMGQIQYIKFDPTKIQNLDYEMKTVPSSTAGVSKETMYSLFSGLVQYGLPLKSFIEIVDLPYKGKILADIDANDQQKAMLQQLMAENEQLKAILNGNQPQ